MTTRIHWLPISYSITHRPYKHRNTTISSVREDIPLAIPEAGTDQAPVALSVVPPPPLGPARARAKQSGYNPEAKDPKTPLVPHDIRVHGGRLYRPVFLQDGTPLTEESLAAFSARARAAEQHQPFPDYPFESSFRARGREEVMGEIHEFRGDNRDQKVEEAQKVAASLLCVDGVIHKPAFEPVIQLQATGGLTATGVTSRPLVRVLMDGSGMADKDGTLFRADEIERAMEIAGEIAARKDGSKVVVEGEIRTELPEFLRFAPSQHSLDSLRTALYRFGQMGFGWNKLSTANIRKWCDAADALVSHLKGDTEFAEVERLVDAFIQSHPDKDDRHLAELTARVRRVGTLPDLRMEADLEGVFLP
jgi:hypothetical protein